MTPRHRYGVHGRYMVWIDEDAGQAGGSVREAVGRVVRGSWTSKSLLTLQQLFL